MGKVPPEHGASHALALVPVPFEGTIIEAALNGDDRTTIRVAVRKFCDDVELDAGAQLRRLHRTHWATVAMMATVAEDGKVREQAMVDLDTFAMWLATIDTARVKESARPLLIAYQKRAARVLREHFFPHVGPPAPAPEAFLHAPREPPELPELAAAVELLGGVDPRVRAALRRLPAPKRPSVAHYVDQARELAQLVERTEPPLPADTHACARLASSLILATNAAPDHPLVLGTREDLARTIATIDRLLARAALDPDLRDRVAELRSRWTAEVERLAR